MVPEVLVINGEPFAFVHDCNAMCGDGKVRLLEHRIIPLDDRWSVAGTDEKATLGPSIQCMACGTHGYWKEGCWEPV